MDAVGATPRCTCSDAFRAAELAEHGDLDPHQDDCYVVSALELPPEPPTITPNVALTDEAMDAVVNALENPPEPTEPLKRLAREHR